MTMLCGLYVVWMLTLARPIIEEARYAVAQSELDRDFLQGWIDWAQHERSLTLGPDGLQLPTGAPGALPGGWSTAVACLVMSGMSYDRLPGLMHQLAVHRGDR